MFGSVMLEVGIGLILVYIVFALACSALSEQVSQFLGLRANNLWDSICALVGDRDGSGIAKELYDHPLVRGLASKQGSLNSSDCEHPADRPMPSYIPSDVFSLALTEVWKTNGEGNEELGKVMGAFENLPGDGVDNLRKNIEVWYEAAMERSIGWYKRKTQLTIFLAALILVTATNADSIMIANKLWNSPTLRSSVVTKAESVGEAGVGSVDIKNTQEVNNLLGWTQCAIGEQCINSLSSNVRPGNADLGGWLAKIFGLLITAYAASLGAPFWFEMLKKFIEARKELVGSSTQSSDKPEKKAGARIGGQS